jgi:uncharacterized protein (DUF934 family)
MRSLISKTAVVTDDPWQVLEGGAGNAPQGTDLLVPLAVWVDARYVLVERAGRLGVWLEPADDPALLAADVGRLSLIAVHFPSFTDGRGFSIARLLRDRHGYRGELRATGPMTRDTLFYLARCGFDAFELREGEDPQASLQELAAFDEVYQGAADRGPLFERRFHAAAPAGR